MLDTGDRKPRRTRGRTCVVLVVADELLSAVGLLAGARPAGVAFVDRGELTSRTVSGTGLLPAWFAVMAGGLPTPEYTVLSTDKVRFVGDPIVLVVSEGWFVAEDACAAVVQSQLGPQPVRHLGRPGGVPCEAGVVVADQLHDTRLLR